MVGAEGFEPPTLCSQSRCATRLRYAPTLFRLYREPAMSIDGTEAQNAGSLTRDSRLFDVQIKTRSAASARPAATA
jgi:hypothetical protein